MGSQQLLLLVVGFVVVVLMIYAGVSMYNSYAQAANRDHLINSIYQLAGSAQQYLKKPANTGGGGGEFTGWDIPERLKDTSYGLLRARVRADRINLVATGVEPGFDGENEVRITAVVDLNSVILRITN